MPSRLQCDKQFGASTICDVTSPESWIINIIYLCIPDEVTLILREPHQNLVIIILYSRSLVRLLIQYYCELQQDMGPHQNVLYIS